MVFVNHYCEPMRRSGEYQPFPTGIHPLVQETFFGLYSLHLKRRLAAGS